jgi:hypothetical protein
MGLGVSLITFSPNTVISSASVNTNFQNLNNASTFVGNVTGNCSGSAGSVAAANIGAGTLPSGVTVPAGNISGSVPSATNASNLVNGSGNAEAYINNTNNYLYVQGIDFPVAETLGAISHFGGTGSGTFNHGLGKTPPNILVTYAGNFGSPPSQAIAWYNLTSTSVSIAAQSGYSWSAFCYGN